MALPAPPTYDYAGTFRKAFDSADTSARDYARIEMEKVRMAEAAVQRARENRANDFKMMLDAVQNRQTLEQRAIENDFRNRQLNLMGDNADTSRYNAQTSRRNAETNLYRAENPRSTAAETLGGAMSDAWRAGRGLTPKTPPPSGGYGLPDIPSLSDEMTGNPAYEDDTEDSTDETGTVPSSMGNIPAGAKDKNAMHVRQEGGPNAALLPQGTVTAGSKANQLLVEEPPPTPAPTVDSPQTAGQGGSSTEDLLPPPVLPSIDQIPATPVNDETWQDMLHGRDIPGPKNVPASAQSSLSPAPPATPPPTNATTQAPAPKGSNLPAQPPAAPPTTLSNNNVDQVTSNNLVYLSQLQDVNTKTMAKTEALLKRYDTIELKGNLDDEERKLLQEDRDKAEAYRTELIEQNSRAKQQEDDLRAHRAKMYELGGKLTKIQDLDKVIPANDLKSLVDMVRDPKKATLAEEYVKDLEAYHAVRKEKRYKHVSNGIETASAVGKIAAELATPDMKKAKIEAQTAKNLRQEIKDLDPKDRDYDTDRKAKKARLENMLDGEAEYNRVLGELDVAVELDTMYEVKPATPPAAEVKPPAPDTAPERPGIELLPKTKTNEFWTAGKAEAHKLAGFDKATNEELELLATGLEAQPYYQRLTNKIKPNFKMPAGGDDKENRGRWGSVKIEDFIKAAAKEEFDKRMAAQGGKPGARNAPSAITPKTGAVLDELGIPK